MKYAFHLLAAGLAAGMANLAEAATFTVTSLNDSGAGSLRDAIAQANAAAGLDTVEFQSGLTGTIPLVSEIRISDAINLRGPGAARIAIDGGNATRLLKVQRAGGDPITATISGLTLRNGHADEGGAIYSSGDHVAANALVLEGNSATSRGGALWVAGANLTIDDSEISNNTAGSGAGILFSAGTLTIRQSLVSGNDADFGGGANILSPAANAVVADSIFMNNAAVHTGGGIWASTMTSFKVSGSTFVGNTTGQPNGGGIFFAGIMDAGAPVNVIENSTFSDNRTTHQFGKGSALAIASGNMTVRNSTFAYNKVAPDLAPGGDGGALWVAGVSATVTLQSTLFAGNTNGNQDALADILRDAGGASESTLGASHCSFETMPGTGIINGLNEANLFATDPRLQPLTLADGGITPVHPLARTSPVIDRGSNPGSLATDQRGVGFTRTWSDPDNRNGTPDIGAYEYRGDTIFVGDFEQH